MAALAAIVPTIFGGTASAATTIGTVATLFSTGISALGTIAAGKQAQREAENEAAQLDIRANVKMAEGQRRGFEHKRRTQLALSALTNRAAASGFTATDPTALDLTEEIATYGSYQQQLAAYGGETGQASDRGLAQAKRISGAAARRGSRYGAFGTIMGGVSTMAGRYG